MEVDTEGSEDVHACPTLEEESQWLAISGSDGTNGALQSRSPAMCESFHTRLRTNLITETVGFIQVAQTVARKYVRSAQILREANC